jgi:hypothetical protein
LPTPSNGRLPGAADRATNEWQRRCGGRNVNNIDLTPLSGFIEITKVSQAAGEPRRRWFVSDALDLVVWWDAAGQPSGFQLCYEQGGSERALTWHSEQGFTHRAVDDGERRCGKHKAIPILLAEGLFDANPVAARFAAESAELPSEVADFVIQKLREHPSYVPEP